MKKLVSSFALVLASYSLFAGAGVSASAAQFDASQVKSFCSKTAAYHQAEHWRKSVRDETPLSDSDLASLLQDEKSARDLWVGDAWTASLYPSIIARKLGYERQISEYSIRDARYHDKQSFRTLLQSPGGMIYYDGHNQLDIEDLIHSSPDNGQELNQAFSQEAALCLSYGLLQANDCRDILHKIRELMAPHMNLTALPVIKEVIENSKYVAGLSAMALKVMDRIETGDTGSAHFFNDLLQSFLNSGVSAKEAEEFAWNTIGVYSARGPNIMMLSFFASPEHSKAILSLAIISSAVNVLDSMSIDTSHPYSLPAEISTLCDAGKPYHFWMTAFLAHKFTQKTKNKTAAINASYLAHLGYQMRSTTQYRDPRRAFTQAPFGMANNKIRLDLIFAAAGAVYGAEAATGGSHRMNIDLGLTSLLNSGESLTPVTAEEAQSLWSEGFGIKGYQRWRKIFSPDSCLDTFLSSSSD